MTLRRLLTVCFNTCAGKVFLLILGIGTCLQVHAQTIEYSRQNFKSPYADAVQLVADVAGYSHLLCLTADENIVLYIYDDNLRLQAKKEVQIKLNVNDDVNVIPFKKFYYLYMHRHGSSNHGLWKIDREGNATAMSEPLQLLIETAFKKNTATLQLVNKNNRLCIIANTYYDTLQKIGTTVTEADENLNIVNSRKVFYDFYKNEEHLKQVMLAGDDLLILKTAADSNGHLLEIIKANLNTGHLLMNAFSSGSHLYSNPILSYNAFDSGVTISSLIGKTFFITKLDYLLNERVPVTLLKTQFKDDVASGFLLLEGQSQKWLDIRFNATRYQSNYTSSTDASYTRASGLSGLDMYGRPMPDYFSNNAIPDVNASGVLYMKRVTYTSGYVAGNSTSNSVRFTVLNTRLKVLKDSIVTNEKSFYTIEPAPSVNIVLKNKSYLFLRNRFGARRQGLLMMSGNNNGELSAKDIRVYDRYEYLLQQLQAVNDSYVLVPYTYKRELGLVKITLD